MRNIFNEPATLVVSQPGDGTLYSFGFIRENNGFRIFPYDSAISYPDYIPSYLLKIQLPPMETRELTEEIINMAKGYEVNPWTMREVIATLQESI